MILLLPAGAHTAQTPQAIRAENISDLKSGDAGKRMEAAGRISRAPGDYDAGVILEAFRKETEPHIRRELARTLAEKKSTEAVSLMYQLLEDEDAEMRRSAANALRHLLSEGGDIRLSEAYAREQRNIVKLAIIYALGGYRTAESLRVLNEALYDTDERLIFQSAVELEGMNTEQADRLLLGLRRNTLGALKELGENAQRRMNKRQKAARENSREQNR